MCSSTRLVMKNRRGTLGFSWKYLSIPMINSSTRSLSSHSSSPSMTMRYGPLKSVQTRETALLNGSYTRLRIWVVKEVTRGRNSSGSASTAFLMIDAVFGIERDSWCASVAGSPAIFPRSPPPRKQKKLPTNWPSAATCSATVCAIALLPQPTWP